MNGVPPANDRIEADAGSAGRRLEADAVLTGEPGGVFRPGVVDVDSSGRVAYAGPPDTAPARSAAWSTERVGGLLMPGLINAHAHTPMTLVRSVGDGLPLHRWLSEAIWPREGRMTADDVWWGMALGSLEMLRAGVTTSCEMYLWDDAMVDAVACTGARMVITPGILGFLHGADLPGRVAEIVDLHAHHHDPHGLITVGFGPHSPYDLAPEMVRDIAAEARRLDTFVHIHLEETQAERQQVMDSHGTSATQLLARHGVFDGPVLAAHGVWLDDSDRRTLGEAGAAVAHCPQSNLKLGSGMAQIVALRAVGVRVVVGTDGPASNDDLDLWDELRLAPMLARGLALDPSVIGADEALAMATVDAGPAICRPDIGSLRPGSWADIIRLDLDHPAFVPAVDAADLVSHVVWAGGAHHVTDVWVAGRPVVAGGEVLGVDRREAVAEVRRRGARLAG